MRTDVPKNSETYKLPSGPNASCAGAAVPSAANKPAEPPGCGEGRVAPVWPSKYKMLPVAWLLT